MLESFRHRLAALIGGRSFEAANGGRFWDGAGYFTSINNANEAGGHVMRSRALYSVRNNAHASAGVASVVASLIGNGIRPHSANQSPEIQKQIDGRFDAWSRNADARGYTTFHGVIAQAVASMVETGDGLAMMLNDPEHGLVLQSLDPRQLPMDYTLPDRRIWQGIELDRRGRPVNFHIYRHMPDEAGTVTTDADLVRVAAEDIIHLFRPLQPGQIRGVSWLAPVLRRLKDLAEYEDAALMKQKLAALLAGVIIDPDGTTVPGKPLSRSGSTVQAKLEAGEMPVLPPGKDVRFFDAPDTGEHEAMIRTHLRAVARGLGITYAQLTGDLSDTTYSSARVGLIEARRFWEQLQHLVIIPQLDRIWRRWLLTETLTGRLAGDIEDLAAVRWSPTAWPWIEPTKDMQGEKLALEMGIKSRSQIIAERGRDPDVVDAERARDRERDSVQEPAE